MRAASARRSQRDFILRSHFVVTRLLTRLSASQRLSKRGGAGARLCVIDGDSPQIYGSQKTVA